MVAKDRCVVIVDDDASVRAALGRLFRSANLKPTVFESAEAFLAKPPTQRFGCLILDVELPGMNGLDLQAHCTVQMPELCVIMISGHDDAAIQRRAIAAGALAFLKKPFDFEVLLELVRQVLAGD